MAESMGLAEPKRKMRYGPNPQGKFIGVNENKGKGLLLKMGWKDGQGLGISKQGITEPVRLKIQMDSKGLGYSLKADPWNEHNQEFDKILNTLNDLKKITAPREKGGDNDSDSHDDDEDEIPKAKKQKSSTKAPVHGYNMYFIKVEDKVKVKEESTADMNLKSEKANDVDECERKSHRKKKSSKLQKTEDFVNEHEDFDDLKIKMEPVVEEEISDQCERSKSKKSKKHKKEKSEVHIKDENVEINQNQSCTTDETEDYIEKKRKKKKSKTIVKVEEMDQEQEEMNQIAENEIVDEHETSQIVKKKHKKKKKSKDILECSEEKSINMQVEEEEVKIEEKLLKSNNHMKDNFKLSSRRKRFVLNPNEVTLVIDSFKGSNLNTLPGYSLY